MARDRFNRPKRKSKLRRVILFVLPAVILIGGRMVLRSTGQDVVVMQKLQQVIGGIVERRMHDQGDSEKQAQFSRGEHPELR